MKRNALLLVAGKDDLPLLTQEGGNDPFAQVNKEASDYGLTVCGQS